MIKIATRMNFGRRQLLQQACTFLLIVAAPLATSHSYGQSNSEPARAQVLSSKGKRTIPQQYIVVLKERTQPAALAAASGRVSSTGAVILQSYDSAIKGFAVRASSAQLARIRALPEVDYIEPDAVVSAWATQTNAPAGLDRLDQRLLTLNGTFSYSETGAGVHVYILDSGIRATHTDFGGRVNTAAAFTAVNDGNGTNDCNGHGTNVASIVAGTTYGVAKAASLHPVRVLDCSGNGTSSGVISGLNWLISNVARPAVANMSLGGGVSPSLDTAVRNAVASGIPVVVAAGNDNADACNYSPARVAEAVGVGNVDPRTDARYITSNFGSCVRLFAPGVQITAAGRQSDTGTSTYTGTSQAAPHVAGAVALYLQYHPNATPAQALNSILGAASSTGTPGWLGVIDPGPGSPQRLLHWRATSDGSHSGDPHITTVDGIKYDFQGTGEFVALRDGRQFEVQTRQRPVSTSGPIFDAHTGVSACVSITSAVAVRLGAHRFTFQGQPPNAPPELRVRINGALTQINYGQPLTLPGGVSVRRFEGHFEVSAEEGPKVTLVYGWWPEQSTWYFGTTITSTRGTEGLLGVLGAGSWLPALPNGASLGPRPADAAQRAAILYGPFTSAWRVSNAISLFDYEAGESEASFQFPSWPPVEGAPCIAANIPEAKPIPLERAAQYCRAIENPIDRRNCVSDIAATGQPGFAAHYRGR